jgi:ubiquinone/menaquinone biosynthesis C-methylase UbiE
MSDPRNTQGYVDNTYLNKLADLLRNIKTTSYDLMQLRSGQQVLDLGCGPANDTLPLAQIVGESGRVVGVDYDPDMIALASQKADKAGVSAYVSHEVHEATQLPFEDDSFDACRSERVFQHLPSPETALAEMIRVTKPGGRIVISDTDWGSIAFGSSLPEIELKVHAAYYHRGARNPLVGRQLHHLLRRAGLLSVSQQVVVLETTDYQTMNLVASLETRIRERGLDGNYFREEEFDRFIADLKQLDAEGNFFAYMCGVLAVGQKPA